MSHKSALLKLVSINNKNNNMEKVSGKITPSLTKPLQLSLNGSPPIKNSGLATDLNKLICKGGCNGVPQNPFECEVCHSIFCEEYILSLLENGDLCPICRSNPPKGKSASETFTRKGIVSQLEERGALILKCPEGCENSFSEIKQFLLHVNQCK